MVDNASGHYCPDYFTNYYALLALGFWRAPIAKDIDVKQVIHPNNVPIIKTY